MTIDLLHRGFLPPLRCVAIGATAILAGCSHIAQPAASPTQKAQQVGSTPSGEPIIPLLDAELTQLFSDVRISNEMTRSSPEHFAADGSYSTGDIVTSRGRFWVENGEVCLANDRSAEAFCRRFGRTAAGDLYQLSHRRGAAETRLDPPLKYELK